MNVAPNQTTNNASQQQQQQFKAEFEQYTVDVAQFYHVNFIRGQEHRLAFIERKVSFI